MEEKYKEILLQNGITDPVKAVQIEPVDTEGNNFSSVCERVTVTFQNGQPNLMLFSKRQLPSEGARKELGNIQAYIKEDFFFSKLLPDLLQFAHEKATYNGFLEHIFPKCYHTDENLLVLANLHCEGYRMLEEKDRYHNFEHGRLALDRLARFHAATYALIQSLGQQGFKSKYPFVHSKNNWSEEGETTRGPWLQMVIDGALKVLREKPTTGSEKALDYFEQFQTRGFLKLTHHFNLENPSCAIVVNHGDYWNANMMFRNGIEGNKQKDCVIVDWQTIHLGSPALDLQFYIFLVVNTEERVKEWMNLLQFYYERFKGYAEQLGQPTLFSFEELVQDFRQRCEPGFIMGMYNVFGITALSLPPDGSGPSMEENILDYLAKAMVFGLDKLMGTRGEEFSKGIVRDFEEFQRVRLNE